jgi:hypothetical protein
LEDIEKDSPIVDGMSSGLDRVIDELKPVRDAGAASRR